MKVQHVKNALLSLVINVDMKESIVEFDLMNVQQVKNTLQGFVIYKYTC
jgi:hypothetical protein